MANTQVSFTDLEAQIKANVDAESSAATLIAGLHAQLDGLKTDQAQIQAFLDSLKASADALAAAVGANTSGTVPSVVGKKISQAEGLARGMTLAQIAAMNQRNK